MLRPILCLAIAALAAAADWTVGWKAASEAATKSKTVILADFTGSDWCSWCIKLRKEVFDTPEFATWAKGRVVLLEVDFPNQGKLTQVQQQENEALAKKYGIQGYPTILILSADGKQLGQLGYQKGGPKPWTEAAQAIIDGAR